VRLPLTATAFEDYSPIASGYSLDIHAGYHATVAINAALYFKREGIPSVAVGTRQFQRQIRIGAPTRTA